MVVGLAACTAQGSDSAGKPQLVWQDEFDGSSLDSSKWQVVEGDGCPANCGFGNNELQYYTAQNATVSKGLLTITGKKDSMGGKAFTSAKLVTKGKGDWKYGRIEVRARLPKGTGTWPAIWMMPTLDRKTSWPRDGEIDIMEHVGYDHGTVHGTIHTEAYNHRMGTQKSATIAVPDVSEVFHTYSLEWDEQALTWLIDGNEYLTLAKNDEGYEGWPFDHPYHLILNLAVGGDWGGKEGVDEHIWPQTFEIDYVRIYQ